ncbi:hypothetical protein CMI47_03360, partial [Candidatus Pacearchaeota archaeon]|nr:hypothetical protein [Candidatus Pacearchaeota archaeon]
MANITLNRKEFEKHIKLTRSVESQIPMFGTPVESINAEEIELEIFPNRPDLLSLQGFVRAFKAFLGKQTGLQKYKTQKSGHKLIVEKSLPKEWPYAVACIVKSLDLNDEKIKEVIDIQEKIGATMMRNRKKGGIGLYPLENIKFPVRFIGRDPDKIKFRPLEFPTEITGRQILSKHPTGRTYANICQDWDKYPIFIDSANNLMSMPPIINAHNMGKIDETTKDVFIEATGPNLETIKQAITIMATTLADMGGKIYSIECVQQNNKKEDIPNMAPETLKINLEDINSLLGLELKESDLQKLLPRMGYDYSNNKV